MAVTAKHKKARIFRDYLISTNGLEMFKEEETEQTILFRSAYPVTEEEKKHFVIIMDDSVYLTMQAIIINKIPEEKKVAVLDLINELQMEHPTIKYVITKDGRLMTSITFPGHENNMDPSIILRCTIEFFKVVAKRHYKRFNEVLNA